MTPDAIREISSTILVQRLVADRAYAQALFEMLPDPAQGLWHQPAVVRAIRTLGKERLKLDWTVVDGFYQNSKRPHSWFAVESPPTNTTFILDVYPVGTMSGAVLHNAGAESSPCHEVFRPAAYPLMTLRSFGEQAHAIVRLASNKVGGNALPLKHG